MDQDALVRQRLAAERGTVHKEAPQQIALVYPSPYHVGMSSLGFQTIYREINDRACSVAERAFLPDREAGAPPPPSTLRTYESGRPVGDFPVIAISVAFELELAGVVEVLQRAGVPLRATERGPGDPVVLCGGPLTNSNPLPLAPFADVIVLGEADDEIHPVLDTLFDSHDRQSALRALAERPHCFVPAIHGEQLPPIARADDTRLPAWAPILTPHTELSDMFLLEAERGCSRGCKYCVMRRSTNGGMRIVPKDKLLSLIPEHARKVGLVGAAVSDHPKIVEIIDTLVEQGRTVGLSSLRPDRLRPEFVRALSRAGGRTLTTALDAASQRLRDSIDRRARERHLLRVAELAREHGFRQLKLYMIVGLPDEQEQDIEELVRFATELSRIQPLALGIAPFVAKRNTPLDGTAFAGIKTVEGRLKQLRRGLRGRVDVRATSARWAWVEYMLAQGGPAEGLAVADAVAAGGDFAAYRSAFGALPDDRPRRALRVVG